MNLKEKKNFNLLKILLIATFCLFACLNTMEGPSITISIKFYKESFFVASFLPAVRDGMNLVFSFIAIFFIIKMGYIRSLVVSLAIMGAACFLFPFISSFVDLVLLFAIIGAIAAITKICIYSLITSSHQGEEEHASALNLLEGFYTAFQFLSFGIFVYFSETVSFWLLSYLADGSDPVSWTHVFWFYAIIAFVLMGFWYLIFTKGDPNRFDTDKKSNQYGNIIEIIKKPKTLIFLCILTLYVYIECSLFSWLPTFYKEELKLDISLSIFISSTFFIYIALGRFTGSYLLKKVKRDHFLLIFISCACIYLFVILFFLKNKNALPFIDPFYIAYFVPAVGFFMGPLYPLMASIVIKTVQNSKVTALLVLMQMFEGLGGIAGPIATGGFFGLFGALNAFFLLLIPLTLLWIGTIFFNIFKVKADSSEYNS